MKPVDDTHVWSVVCSYVPRAYRGRGLQHRLLAAAIEFARHSGAAVLEAYPVVARRRRRAVRIRCFLVRASRCRGGSLTVGADGVELLVRCRLCGHRGHAEEESAK